MARENKLQIRIEARAEQFQQALAKLDADSKATAANVSKNFESGGQGAEKLAQVIENVADSFTEVKQGAKKELSQVEKAAVEAGAKLEGSLDNVEADALIREIDRVEKAFSDLSSQSSQRIQALEKTIDGLDNQLKKLNQTTQKTELADAAGKLNSDVQAVAGVFSDAADDARQLERGIALAFTDTKDVEKFTQVARNLKREFQGLVDTDELVLGIQRANTLGVATEKNLGRFINIAKATGKGIDDVADDFGEFLADVNGGVVDPAVLETIRANFGIGAKELEKYGAVLDSNKKLLTRNRAETKLAQNAILAYVDANQRFQKVSERAADNQSKAAAELGKFTDSVGDATNELREMAAEALLDVLKYLNEMPDGAKVAAAGLAQLASTGAAVGSKVLELGAFASILASNLGGPLVKAAKLAAGAIGTQGLAGAAGSAITAVKGLGGGLLATAGTVAAFVVGIGAAIAGIALIVKSGYDWQQSIKEVEKAQKSLISTQEKLLKDARFAKYSKQNVDAIQTELDAIEDYAKRRAEASAAIAAKDAEAEKARQAGDSKRAGQFQAEADSLRRFRKFYDDDQAAVQKAEKAKTEARQRAYDAALDAFNDFKLKTQRGEFESADAALQALNRISSGLDSDALKEANAEKKKLQQEALKNALDTAKAEAAAGKISVDQFERQSQQLISKYQARGQARKETERDVTEFVKAQNEQRYQTTLQYENQLTQLQQQRLAGQKSAANPQLEALQKRLEKGEEVEAQVKAELTEQNKVTKSIIDQEAAVQRVIIAREKEAELRKDALTGGDNTESIEKIAAEKTKALNEQVAREKAALDKQLASEKEKLDDSAAKKAAELQSKLAELARQRFEVEKQASAEAFELRRQQIDEEERLGQDVGQKRIDLEKEISEFKKKLLQDELQRELDLITAKRDAANVGATDAQKRINNAQAELDIEKAKAKVQKDTKDIADQDLQKAREKTNEIREQLKEQKKLNDEVEKGFKIKSSFGNVTQGIEGLNEFGGGFGQSAFKNRGADSESSSEAKKQSEEDLRKAEARAKVAEIEAAEKARGPQEKKTPIDDASRPQTRTSEPIGDGQTATERYKQDPQQSATQAYQQQPQNSVATDALLQAGNQKTDAVIRLLTTIAQQGTQTNRGNDGTDLARGTDPTIY